VADRVVNVPEELLRRFGLRGSVSVVSMQDEPTARRAINYDISAFNIRWYRRREKEVAEVFRRVEDAAGEERREVLAVFDATEVPRRQYAPRRMPGERVRDDGRHLLVPDCTRRLFLRLAQEIEEREYAETTGVVLPSDEPIVAGDTPLPAPLPLNSCPNCGQIFVTAEAKIDHIREHCLKG
jgi:hypothetical protein